LVKKSKRWWSILWVDSRKKEKNSWLVNYWLNFSFRIVWLIHFFFHSKQNLSLSLFWMIFQAPK
jgi:hypothetical protein